MSADINSDLIKVCEKYGPEIVGLRHKDQPVMGSRLLVTLAGLESGFGRQREYVRHEAAYAPGGKYYKDSEYLRALHAKWGCLASSSYGTFQLMFVTARELGYIGHPIELQQDDVCAYWATQLITQRFIKRFKAATLKDILDAYNSGHHKDAYIPTVYIERGFEIYDELQNV